MLSRFQSHCLAAGEQGLLVGDGHGGERCGGMDAQAVDLGADPADRAVRQGE